jgi:hypothetical protein
LQDSSKDVSQDASALQDSLKDVSQDASALQDSSKDVSQDASALQDSSKDVSQDASQDFSKGIFAKQSYTVSYEVSRILSLPLSRTVWQYPSLLLD